MKGVSLFCEFDGGITWSPKVCTILAAKKAIVLHTLGVQVEQECGLSVLDHTSRNFLRVPTGSEALGLEYLGGPGKVYTFINQPGNRITSTGPVLARPESNGGGGAYTDMHLCGLGRGAVLSFVPHFCRRSLHRLGKSLHPAIYEPHDVESCDSRT